MPRTLLLADASVTMRKVVEMSFASEDVVVTTADNGDEAIAKARSERPDVLLVNVGIPGTDGYDVCAAVKSDPTLAHVPVLLLTGAFEPFDEERARQAGADARIMKPFESQALVDQVNALLARAPQPQATPSAPQAPEAPPEQSFEFFDDVAPPPAAEAAPDLGAAPDLDADDDLEPLELEPVAVDPNSDLAEVSAIELEPMVEEPEPSLAPEAEIEWSPEALGATPPLGSPAPPTETTFAEAAPDGASSPLAAPTPLRAPEESELAATHLFGDEDLPASVPPAGAEEVASPEDALDLDFSPPPLDATPPPDLEAAGPPGPGGPELAAEPPPEERDPIADTVPPAPFSDPLASLQPEELVEEAVLDPAAARGHDVSSSDLGDPLAQGPGPGPEGPEAPPWEATEAEPGEASAPDWADARPASLDLPSPGTVEPPASAAEFDWDAAPEPRSAPEAAWSPEPPAFRTAAGSEEPAAAPAGPAGPAEPVPSPAEVPTPRAPGIRDSVLHDRLEKLAWEAFGDVSDRIVRDAVARIEAIAWEVIPQMAEALIREEIRRLKGEDD